MLNTPEYEEAGLSDWLRQAPAHLLFNNLGMESRFPAHGPIVPG